MAHSLKHFGQRKGDINNFPPSSREPGISAERDVKLPNLSIATKLYLIFALLATITIAFASVTLFNARRMLPLRTSSAPPSREQ
jgi:hypothetical protein